MVGAGIRRSLLLTLAAAGAVALLSGCVVEAGSGGAGGGGGAGPRDSTDANADTPGDEAGATAAAKCLIGSWQLRNETFEAAMSELLRNAPDAPAEITSATNITLSGGSFIRFDADGAYAAWQDDFTMTFEAQGQRIDHVQSSRDSATYAADAEHIWVGGFEQHEWNAEMRIAGLATVALEAGDSMASVDFFTFQTEAPATHRELVDGAARYECTGDSLVLHADGGMSAGFARTADGS